MNYDNVIFLSNFDPTRMGKKKQVLYLSNHGDSLALLQSFHGIKVECASSTQALNIQLYSWKRWDLIFIESDLKWADPKEIIEIIHQELQIPVTLINNDCHEEDSLSRLKDFYDAGLFDSLRTPLCPKELAEVLRALIP